MNILLKSFLTKSYWKSFVLSGSTWATFFAVLGGVYLTLEILDFFSIVSSKDYPKSFVFLVCIMAMAIAVALKRPVSRVVYKVPTKDLLIEIRVGDIFKCRGDIVISTNVTFDTDTTNSLISTESLQGQFASEYYSGKLAELDKQIDDALSGVASNPINRGWGKSREYPIGTVAKISTHGQNFYWLAMAALDENRTARTDPNDVDAILNSLWQFIRSHGEMNQVVVPVIGTGRGRLNIQRRKMIEKIVQSFISASKVSAFAEGLTVVVHPSDAEKAELSLFEVKDHLNRNIE